MTHGHGAGRVVHGTSNEGTEEGKTCPLVEYEACDGLEEMKVDVPNYHYMLGISQWR